MSYQIRQGAEELSKQPFADVLQNKCFLNFCNIQGKILMLSLFDKVAGLQACNFIKKSLWRRCFSVNIFTFSRGAFLLKTFGGCFWDSFVCLFIYLFTYLFVYLFACLFIYLSICFIYLFIYLFIPLVIYSFDFSKWFRILKVHIK